MKLNNKAQNNAFCPIIFANSWSAFSVFLAWVEVANNRPSLGCSSFWIPLPICLQCSVEPPIRQADDAPIRIGESEEVTVAARHKVIFKTDTTTLCCEIIVESLSGCASIGLTRNELATPLNNSPQTWGWLNIGLHLQLKGCAEVPQAKAVEVCGNRPAFNRASLLASFA